MKAKTMDPMKQVILTNWKITDKCFKINNQIITDWASRNIAPENRIEVLRALNEFMLSENFYQGNIYDRFTETKANVINNIFKACKLGAWILSIKLIQFWFDNDLIDKCEKAALMMYADFIKNN